MTHRRLLALKQLAERPGTEPEGKLASELYEKYKDSSVESEEDFDEILQNPDKLANWLRANPDKQIEILDHLWKRFYSIFHYPG